MERKARNRKLLSRHCFEIPSEGGEQDAPGPYKNGIPIEGSLDDLAGGSGPRRLQISFGYLWWKYPIGLEFCVGSCREMVFGY